VTAADLPPLFLTLASPDDEHSETVEVAGPRVIRFAIGTRTRRSRTWRVWSNARTSDVYVGVRNFAGFQKFSLHESGQWHHAFVNDDAARRQGLMSRFLDTWDRPDNAPAGWTKALAVKVPGGSLSALPHVADDDDVLWLPDAPEGRVAVIGIGVVEPDRGWAEFRGRPVAAYRLANGNAVVLMYETEEITDDHRRTITDAASRIPQDKANEIREWVRSADADAPRMGLFGNDADGVRVVWDLRIDGPPVTCEASALPED
jgi:hypothetical protein